MLTVQEPLEDDLKRQPKKMPGLEDWLNSPLDIIQNLYGNVWKPLDVLKLCKFLTLVVILHTGIPFFCHRYWAPSSLFQMRLALSSSVAHAGFLYCLGEKVCQQPADDPYHPLPSGQFPVFS